MADTNVGISLPPREPIVFMGIRRYGENYTNDFQLSQEEARELARGLILMADLYDDLKKRDPKTGRFRKEAA